MDHEDQLVAPRSTAMAMEKAASASAKQREVLEAIRRRGGAARVNDIAAAVGAHTNTVRGHLEVLMDAGVITAESQKTPGRGRPWLLYCLRSPRPIELVSEYIGLVGVLATEIRRRASAADVDIANHAEELGRAWAKRGVRTGIEGADAEIAGDSAPWIETDDPTGAALRDLRRLGFDPYNRGDATIGLRACPFVRADGTAPDAVICHIHAGYIRERAGRNSVGLVPFDRRGECGIGLNVDEETRDEAWTQC